MRDIERTISRHLERLCVDIGPRPNGSVGNQQAADYIGTIFRQAGLTVERQEYACPGWECRQTLLSLDGESLPASANAFSPPCDVAAPAIAVKTLAELEAAELHGRIAILHGDLTRETLGCKSWFLTSDRDRRIIQLLEEGRPAALLAVQPKPSELERLIEDWEFHIPSATVDAMTGRAVLRRPSPILRLQIDSRQWSSRTCNVVARKAGQDEARIVLCAHYDTKIDTPGALDNGSGVAALLALADVLGERENTCGLEWIAFTGEEYLPTGDEEYLRRHEAEFGQIVAAVNTDLAGARLGANSITTISRSEGCHELIVGVTARYPGVVWVDPWPESNHSTFSYRGVPAIAISSVGMPPVQHQRRDTVEWIDPVALDEVVRLIAEIVDSLQGRSPAWCRPPA